MISKNKIGEARHALLNAAEERSGPKGIFLIPFLHIASYFLYKSTQYVFLNLGKLKMLLLSKLSTIEVLVMNLVQLKQFFEFEKRRLGGDFG